MATTVSIIKHQKYFFVQPIIRFKNAKTDKVI